MAWYPRRTFSTRLRSRFRCQPRSHEEKHGGTGATVLGDLGEEDAQQGVAGVVLELLAPAREQELDSPEQLSHGREVGVDGRRALEQREPPVGGLVVALGRLHERQAPRVVLSHQEQPLVLQREPLVGRGLLLLVHARVSANTRPGGRESPQEAGKAPPRAPCARPAAGRRRARCGAAAAGSPCRRAAARPCRGRLESRAACRLPRLSRGETKWAGIVKASQRLFPRLIFKSSAER